MTTKEKMAVMQAYEDGKAIQVKGIEEDAKWWGDWTKPHAPAWDWRCFVYRVKSEPFKQEIEIFSSQGFHEHLMIPCIDVPREGKYRITIEEIL